MNFVSHGLSLSYEEHGPVDAIPVLLIHGFPFSRQMWQPQVKVLAGQYRTITFDNRGHGQSEVGDGQYPFEWYVDDVIALLDHLKLQTTVVCGLSMGGYVALRALERFPERFIAAILCDTRSEADTNEAKIKRAAAVGTIKEKGVAVFAEAFLQSAFAPSSFQKNSNSIEFIRQIINANTPLGISGTLLSMAGRTDTTESLNRLHLPVLIMVGDKDTITPPSAAQALRGRIPGARLEIIPEAGHLSNLENTRDFNHHLLAFLSTLSA